MTVLLHRRLTTLIVAALVVCMAVASLALASGRDVLDDYDDDGQIQRCYTDADFTEALGLADTNREVYGAAIDLIEQRQLECADTTVTTTASADDTDDGNAALWGVLGLIAVAAVGAAGYLGWARRQRHDGDTDRTP